MTFLSKKYRVKVIKAPLLFALLAKRGKLLIAFAAVLFFSCSDNDDISIPEDVTVQNFMWKAMNEWYFWQEAVPDLADDRFASDEELNAFLRATPDPEDFIRSILFSEDRFTFWDDDFEDLINRLSGVSRNNGLQFFLINLSEDDTDNLFGFVRNVIPGSDADTKGLKRGDVFYGVDGQVLTEANFRTLLFGENDTYTLNMGEVDVANRLVNQTTEEITLTKIENFQEPPVRLARTLDVNGTKIGYLMYRQFNRNFNEALNDAFGQFVADGVTDLVLDLRYNGGGSVNTSRLLASMIYGKNTNELYLRQRWNNKEQAKRSAAQLEDYFAAEISSGTPLNSLNLNRVFVLGTGRTASASELVMNGLDPYIDVIHIGTTTRGKNEFSISLVDAPDDRYIYRSSRIGNINPDNRWIIQPLVGRNENADGFSDYTAGFTPDIALSEDFFNLGSFGGIEEPLLARAIAEITGQSAKTSSASKTPILEKIIAYDAPLNEISILDKQQ